MFRLSLIASSLFLGAALSGCPTTEAAPDAASTTDAHTSAEDAPIASRPSCDALFAACHDADTGSGPAHECHELGHDETTTEASCAAELTRCTMLCAAIIAVDAGPIDAGPPTDAPHAH